LDAAEGKARALYTLAEISKNKRDYIENLKNSLSAYEFLVELVDKHRKRSFSENDNRILGETYDSVFNNTIKVANLVFRTTGDSIQLKKAFIYSDLKKAYVVSGRLIDFQNKKTGNIPDSLLVKEKNLLHEIAYLEGMKSENRLTGTERLLKLTDGLEKLISKFENDYPDYYWLKYKTKTVEIPTLYHQLNKEKTLIEYCFVSDSLFTFIVVNNKIHLVSQSSKGIEDSILIFRKKLSLLNNAAFASKGISQFVHEASWLYKILIKPAESYIQGKALTIVPDGAISLLPFDALLTSDSLPKQSDYGMLPYILYKYTISYAYSAELFSMLQQMRPAVTDGVLAFAPEYKNFLYNRPGSLSKKSETLILSSLPGSQEEAGNISKTFGGKAITGKQATEELFKKHTSDNKILHLATHTIIDNEYPMYSKLVFYSTKNTAEDGFLNTYEIYNLNLKTPLIVLSACNSGYGKLMKGEGLISLARGFIYAGCPSMVITLWNIADRSSSNLMQLFYRNLSLNQNIDKSLQNAKIEYIQNSDQRLAHPYYWAGFIETGKTSPIVKIKTSNWQKWLILFSGEILVVFGLTAYFKKRS
jgi:CHAT domain-containing protein